MVARRNEFYVRVARTISHRRVRAAKRVRYCSFHENIKFIFSSQRVIFFLLYKHTDDDVFDDFPKISEDFPKLFRRPDERSRTGLVWYTNKAHFADMVAILNFIVLIKYIIIVTCTL